MSSLLKFSMLTMPASTQNFFSILFCLHHLLYPLIRGSYEDCLMPQGLHLTLSELLYSHALTFLEHYKQAILSHVPFSSTDIGTLYIDRLTNSCLWNSCSF